MPSHLYTAYLDLMKHSLGDFLYDSDAARRHHFQPYTYTHLQTGEKVTLSDYEALKAEGLIDSKSAHTLIGLKRMAQLQSAIETLDREGIHGDFLEAGVLRGGACILMRAVLHALQNTQRIVWVADSFQGFPEAELTAHGIKNPEQFNRQAASLAEVKSLFARYHLLDEQVRFLPGFFEHTLPDAPVKDLALLRLDGDFYNATTCILKHLYPKVVNGGFVIIDDYYIFEGCRRAVREYRSAHQIKTPLERIDAAAVFWRKEVHKTV
jgi:O-methyltransferase